jgi:hypothetical protein
VKSFTKVAFFTLLFACIAFLGCRHSGSTIDVSDPMPK